MSALVGLGSLIGCGGENLGGDPAPKLDTNGAAGTGGSDAGLDASEPEASAGAAGASGAAGSGSLQADRGDPDTFPTACLETCENACKRLDSCGGADSSTFPLDEDSCLERCELAGIMPGGSGDVGAETFRCCVAQDDCSSVMECGGWLAHPDTVGPCDRFCDCMFSGAIATLTAGHTAPEGYRFAPNVLMLEPTTSVLDVTLPKGVQRIEGRQNLVRLDDATTQKTLAELSRVGRILPTFVDSAGRFSAATGDVVVVAEDDVAASKVHALASAYELGSPRAIRSRLRAAPASRITVWHGADPWRALDAVAALSSVEGVHAELDQLRRYVKRHTPNDPRYSEQWHLRNDGQAGSTVSVDGRVSEAWDITMGDASVIIAINDDGVDLNHPEFAGKLEPELNYPTDWVDQMAQWEFGWHGTSVAGVAAAAADNGEGGAGVCPNCHILPRLLGDTTNQGFMISDAEVADGLETLVDAGAAVINNSWGLDMGDPVYADPVSGIPPLSTIVKAAFDYAENNGRNGLGTVILFAAGNSNYELDPYTAYDTIVAVSAVDDLGLKPYYSSFGSDVDVAAPSNGGLNGIIAAAPNGGYTDDFGGTSSASPFVAGVFGLVFSANADLTAQEARDAVRSTATKIDPVFGAWDQDGHSDFHGSGLVNAYAAVQLAAGGCATPDTCIAPSDECGANCGTKTQCDVCRTHADCADGYVCQALPSLGELVCVAGKGAGDCPAGTNEVRGYCLPTPTTCGLCGGEETCNGRDDDCNGLVDDGVCQGGPLCFIDGPGCEAGTVCAGRTCVEACETDDDCSDGTCEPLTDQYGEETGEKACTRTGPGGYECQSICQALVSGLVDESISAFADCIESSLTCGAVTDCRSILL